MHHVGISFHDSAEVLDQILTEYPQIEVVQIQFNYVDYEDPIVQSRKVYETAARHGKPVIVMEPVKGGKLVELPDEAQKIYDDLHGGSNASYAIRFAAGFENMMMVLSGMSTIGQLEENVSYMSDFKPLSEKERAAVEQVQKIFSSQGLIPCTACRYCVDGCPMRISIPDLFSVMNGGADTESIRTQLTAEELRSFMAEKYGKPLYDRRQIGEIERRLCTGNHANCHLHFTRGEQIPGHIRNGFEALQREREAAQIERNRRYYQEHLAQNYTAVRKLTEKIQNSVLLHLQPSPVRANAGSLCGGRVWRATELGDENVFIRDEQGNVGDLSVDILLDASTSQKRRQEIVSNQGYIIAEALSLCGIPCRVSAFCSMTGYTILRIYRDYGEQRGSNRRIFEYVSNGCNRDGLAIRAMHYLMNQGSCEHKILIILSDVKPNDIRRIQNRDGSEPTPYEGGAGVTDTAYEVRRARADGIAVICAFTGDDEDLPSAKLVYGRDFATIRSLDRLADSIGLLLQNQIRNL